MESEIQAFVHQLGRDYGRAPTTQDRYGRLLRRLVAFAEKERGRELASPADLPHELVARFIHEGEDPPGAAPISASSKKQRRAAIRRWFEFLIAEGVATADPTKGIALPPVRSRSPDYVSPDDLVTLLEAVLASASPHYEARNTALIMTMFGSGLRVSEVVGIEIHQLNLPGLKINGCKRKGGRREDIFLVPQAARALARWLEARKFFRNADSCTAVFLSDRGSRWSVRQVQRMFANCVRAAGLSKRLTTHSLRHGFGTALAGEHVDLDIISKLMGHASLATTSIYLHVADPRKRAALQCLSALLAAYITGNEAISNLLGIPHATSAREEPITGANNKEPRLTASMTGGSIATDSTTGNAGYATISVPGPRSEA